MNIYSKLVEVRKFVNYLQKSEQGQQYKYVSSRQVLESVREKMNELNLLLVPKILSHYVTAKEKQSSKGSITTEYFTELDIEYTWINADEPSETISIPWYGQGIDTAGEKGVGKALTYAEKYFMLKQFNIPTDKDDPDSMQGEKVEKEKPKLNRYSSSNQNQQRPRQPQNNQSDKSSGQAKTSKQPDKQQLSTSQPNAKERWLKAINELNAYGEECGLTREELRKQGTEVTKKDNPKYWTMDDIKKIRDYIESVMNGTSDQPNRDIDDISLPSDDDLPF